MQTIAAPQGPHQVTRCSVTSKLSGSSDPHLSQGELRMKHRNTFWQPWRILFQIPSWGMYTFGIYLSSSSEIRAIYILHTYENSGLDCRNKYTTAQGLLPLQKTMKHSGISIFCPNYLQSKLDISNWQVIPLRTELWNNFSPGLTIKCVGENWQAG